jgi:hypothetical protein
MRRVTALTPRMEKLRAHLLPYLQRRGTASHLARLCSINGGEKRQQVSLWFKQGKGRPGAAAALLAARLLVAQLDWRDEEWYIPTWDELVQILIPLLTIRGKAAELARFCDREPYAISRYFSRSPRQRREPDGEVALAALDWLTRRRIEYSLVENEFSPMPPPREWRALQQAFAVEEKLKDAFERIEGKKLYLPGDDLFHA